LIIDNIRNNLKLEEWATVFEPENASKSPIETAFSFPRQRDRQKYPPFP
jgi:hypothetical protein